MAFNQFEDDPVENRSSPAVAYQQNKTTAAASKVSKPSQAKQLANPAPLRLAHQPSPNQNKKLQNLQKMVIKNNPKPLPNDFSNGLSINSSR